MKKKTLMILGFMLFTVAITFITTTPVFPGSGTCCPEGGSICYVDGNPPVYNYYYKASGSCNPGG